MTFSQPQRAFTLVEVALAMLVIATLLAGLALPLAAQVQLRRQDDTRRMLDEAREALMGFAAATGRLPCPATESSSGQESFAPGGDAANGNCSNFHDGLLPAAALGLSPLDSEGFARDAWGARANRLRYAVAGSFPIHGVAHPFTRAGGLQAVTLEGLGNAPHFLMICAGAAGASAASCGPAANHLTRRAAFVIHSSGPNAPSTPAAGSDEALNRDSGPTFVSRHGAGVEFDDLVAWAPVTVLASRLMAAGRLP
jgi:prepilin-type N-terminal cleavage/methylation domain-containing protein